MDNVNDTIPGGRYIEVRGGREVFVDCNGEEIGTAPKLTSEQQEIVVLKQRIDELTAQNAELTAKIVSVDAIVPNDSTAKPPKSPAQAPIVAP